MGDYGSMPGYSGSNTGFMSGRVLSEEDTARYIAENSFDPTYLIWTENEYGEKDIALPGEQWELVEGLAYNLFYDNGDGYINMGMDVAYDFDEQGRLMAPEKTWIAINNQPVAFYHEFSLGSGDALIVNGYVPALVNGERVDILLVWQNDEWSITGLRQVYADGETEAVAKAIPGVFDSADGDLADWAKAAEKPFWKVGDTIDFLAEFWTYAGVYEDSYIIGDPMTVTENMTVSDVTIDEGTVRQSYRFTDIYQQHYWTPALVQ
jgi:hypothetical protein